MPPQSRGSPLRPPLTHTAFQSRSTPVLPTVRSMRDGQHQPSSSNSTATTTTKKSTNGTPATLRPERSTIAFPDIENDSSITSPSEAASVDDFPYNSLANPPSLSPASSAAYDDDDDDDDDQDEEEEEEDGHVPSLPARPMYYHHSRSHTHLAPSTFAPPFYNRPPTPLPPSPSLTSLLRPNFSSQNSRPGTPDPSSDEGSAPRQQHRLHDHHVHDHHRDALSPPATGAQTPNSAAASALSSTFRSAKPIPRASPPVPTYEYYGFTLYLTSSVAFGAYVLWAFLPAPFLHQLGIHYFPDRWWALALPAWAVMFVVYIYVALAAYNLGYLTLPLHNVEALVDEAASVAVVDAKGNIVRGAVASWRARSKERTAAPAAGGGGGSTNKKARAKAGRAHGSHPSQTRIPDLDWRTLWNEGTDAVMDIPIGGVCEILYGAGDEEEEERGDEGDCDATYNAGSKWK